MPSWPAYGVRVELWEAVYGEDLNAVQRLLASSRGKDHVNTPHGIWQQTSAHLAVTRGNRKLLSYLVYAGANVNGQSINGTTPLHLAVEMNRKDLVQDLVLAGANPLLRNFTGKNAIQMAHDRNLSQIASILQQQVDGLASQQALRQHLRVNN